MDDWVIMSTTRWKLKKAIAKVNEALNQLGFVKHPDKTFIGRITAGFDFLGYHFKHSLKKISPFSNKPDKAVLPPNPTSQESKVSKLSIAQKSILQLFANITQLYEQGASTKRIGQYQRRWISVWDKRVCWSESLYISTLRCTKKTPRFIISKPKMSKPH